MPSLQRLLLLLAVLICTATVQGQFGGPAAKPAAKAVKSDVKYIKCQVCEAIAKHAIREVKTMREQLKPGKKLDEFKVIELIEKLTDPSSEAGEWLARLDLQEDGAKLKVVDMGQLSHCDSSSECKTLVRAAEEVLGDHDTDVAEALWKGHMNRAQLTKWLCQELTRSCRGKVPPLPRDRKPGPEFQAMDSKEAEMQKMLAGMKASGMGGEIYDRDSAMKKYMAMSESGDMEEDDDADWEGISDASGGGDSTGKLTQQLGAGASKLSDAAQAAGAAAKEGLSSAFNMAKGLFGSKSTTEQKGPDLESEL